MKTHLASERRPPARRETNDTQEDAGPAAGAPRLPLSHSTRRDFVKTSSSAVLAAALASPLEFPAVLRGFLGARQQQGCYGDNSLYIYGTKGCGQARRGKSVAEITGETNWKYPRALQETDVMHQTEHTEFFASLRAGQPICDGEWMAHSTLAAI